MPAHHYYALIASLPYLPPFERARHLPISREHLDQRLAMLRPADRAVVRQAEDFLEWQHQPLEPSDTQIVERYDAWQKTIREPVLAELAHFRLLLRTVTAAFRYRRLGRPLPARTWGIEPWASLIARHSGRPDFGLAPRLPWVPAIGELMARHEPLALQAHLMRTVWKNLDAAGGRHRFTVSNVIVYLFKWDILRRWLAHDPAVARTTLRRLLAECGV